jgi:predicted RNase H-like HicB family nuclease
MGCPVPDLPGCVATARTIDGVIRRIQAAIRPPLEGLREDGVPPPRPRPRVVLPRRESGEIDVDAGVEVAA